jgi:hypothetical protein
MDSNDRTVLRNAGKFKRCNAVSMRNEIRTRDEDGERWTPEQRGTVKVEAPAGAMAR